MIFLPELLINTVGKALALQTSFILGHIFVFNLAFSSHFGLILCVWFHPTSRGTGRENTEHPSSGRVHWIPSTILCLLRRWEQRRESVLMPPMDVLYGFSFSQTPSLVSLPVVVSCPRCLQVTISVYLWITMRCCDWYSLYPTFPRYLLSLWWSKHINTTQLGLSFNKTRTGRHSLVWFGQPAKRDKV